MTLTSGVAGGAAWGVAYLDVSTGEFAATELAESEAIEELAHFHEYQHLIVNDELERAYQVMRAIYLTRRYGSVLCSAMAGNLSFSHATGSEKVLGNFEPVTPEYLSGLLMQYRVGGGH